MRLSRRHSIRDYPIITVLQNSVLDAYLALCGSRFVLTEKRHVVGESYRLFCRSSMRHDDVYFIVSSVQLTLGGVALAVTAAFWLRSNKFHPIRWGFLPSLFADGLMIMNYLPLHIMPLFAKWKHVLMTADSIACSLSAVIMCAAVIGTYCKH